MTDHFRSATRIFREQGSTERAHQKFLKKEGKACEYCFSDSYVEKYGGRCTDVAALKTNESYCCLSGKGEKEGRGEATGKFSKSRLSYLRETL